MKTVKVALINNINYCKYPDGIYDIEAFIAFLNTHYHAYFALESYAEKGGIAPFLIAEEVETEKQYWRSENIRLVKEAEVYLLPREEYMKRLKTVMTEKCAHCVHDSKDICGENGKPHIEHIALNGECWDFEKGK